MQVGVSPLKLVVWEGFVCSNLALEGRWRLCQKLLYGEGTEIPGATSPWPRWPLARGSLDGLWSEGAYSCDWQGLEFEAITLEPEEAWGLRGLCGSPGQLSGQSPCGYLNFCDLERECLLQLAPWALSLPHSCPDFGPRPQNLLTLFPASRGQAWR